MKDCIKNGILYHNGRPSLCLGLSYYPSYHPKKHPVPPEGDRYAELEKDIPEMVQAGFNLVRFAALGDVKRTGPGAEGIEVSFPLIDACMRAAEKAGIAVQVRLQGYTLNVSGYTDDAMVTPSGRELGPYEVFLRASLNHDGITKDNEDCTAASARHFAAFPALVSYQIYNEPAYHFGVDYNPHSIAAWRKWLVEKGLKTAEEAASLEPPRSRPRRSLDSKSDPGEDYHDWMYWRLFHYERLNAYLCHMDAVARKVNPDAENMTCLMPCPLTPGAMMQGEDYYRTAEGMEILANTLYIPAFGESLYKCTMALDAEESAAAVFGKHAWLVEYNARTVMPGSEWDRETYAAVGAGIKGIMYYQWRADYPYPDAPEPDQFGILHHDRKKTAAYSHAVKMNRLINDKLTEKIALAEKLRAGVAVLFSESANALCDATENDCGTLSRGMEMSYRCFRKAGVPVDFVRACDLKQNPLGVKLLIVPAGVKYYPEEERNMIADFIAQGGKAVYCTQNDAFAPFFPDGSVMRWQESDDGEYALQPVRTFNPAGNIQLHGHLESQDCAEDVLSDAGIEPVFTSSDRRVDVRVLTGKGYRIACLINSDTKERPVQNAVLTLAEKETVRSAVLYTPDGETPLVCTQQNGRIAVALPELTQGGFLVLET